MPEDNKPIADVGTLSGPALTRAMFAEFDGIEGFAKQLKIDFNACKPGAGARVRILTEMIKSVFAGAGQPEEDEDDPEAIEAELKRLRDSG